MAVHNKFSCEPVEWRGRLSKAAKLALAVAAAFALHGWLWPAPQAAARDGRLIVAQGTPQGPYEEPPAMKGKTPEEKMNMRFPQPAKVGDLIGLPVLDDYDLTIGYVRHVVRTPQGKIQLVVTQGGWLGPWFGIGTRLVAVPIEVVAILARQINALDMSRQEFAAAPTWTEGGDQTLAPTESIRIALARR
jgi:hypothetical protein